LFFKPDGTKMYVVGSQNDNVYQYSLSTAWDVSTASYDSVSFSVASQETGPESVTFSPDGTKMYVGGTANDTVYQYTLSTGWDLSTASYASKSLSVSSQDATLTGFCFNSDGTKLFASGTVSDSIYQYNLSTAYDVSTGSYASKSLDVSSEETNPRDVFLADDDKTLYVVAAATQDAVLKYVMTTANDLSTAYYTGDRLDLSGEQVLAQSFFMRSDKKVGYTVDSFTVDTVFQYDLAQYPAASPVTITGLTNGTSYTFNVWAINPFGWSSPSDASGSVSPVAKTAVFAGGGTFGNRLTLDYINIATTGNAQDWGDFAATRTNVGSASSTTRGLFAAGEYGGSNSNVIEYINFSAQGTVSDFGDLTYTADRAEGVSNSTYGIFVYGTSLNVVTMATTGNATSFGSLTTQRNDASSCSSPVYGYFSGNNGGTDNIEYITISTSGSGTSFGNLTAGSNAGAGCSSETRGVLALGFSSGTYTNIIDYITLTTSGSGSDFGDLTTTNGYFAGTSSSVRGVFAGGYNGSMVNIISYVTIATTGNATDFGDLTSARDSLGAVSNDHGGLQ
jgi:hypothetical protein